MELEVSAELDFTLQAGADDQIRQNDKGGLSLLPAGLSPDWPPRAEPRHTASDLLPGRRRVQIIESHTKTSVA